MQGESASGEYADADRVAKCTWADDRPSASTATTSVPSATSGTARARWLADEYGADVTWLPFDLHPEYPPEGLSRETLDAKYGGEPWREGLIAMFEEEGLPASREITRVPNSMKALRS